MKYKHARIINLPKNNQQVKQLFDIALSQCFHSWIDEKGTKDNPGIFQRKLSKISYEEAFKIIQNNKPHWTIYFRNVSFISENEKDYWEFSGCNIASNDYGDVFIWIQVDPQIAQEIFQQFNLQIEEY